MADEEQARRQRREMRHVAKEATAPEPQPAKWVPPTRQAAGGGAGTPAYPSFGDAARRAQPALDAAVRAHPDRAAQELVAGLRDNEGAEQLTRFVEALRRRLGGEAPPGSDALETGPLHERLQALEERVQELTDRVAGASARPPLEMPEGTPPGQVLLRRVQGLVRQSPADGARLVRTMLMEGEEATGEAGESRIRKVAILGVSLGDEVLGEVLKHLSDYEIEETTQAIAGLKGVRAEVTDQVLEEFERHLTAREWVSVGGVDFARAALERAVGPRKTQEILERVTSRGSSGLYMLRNVAPDQIAPFISHEHPQTVALILSQLDAAQASGILAQLPERMQADVAYRIATMENITPNVIRQIEESLESSLRDLLGGNQDVGGPKVVADVLNLTGSSVEKNVLDQMDRQDPEVAEAVRNLMFVFEDISKLTDREIQILMREVDRRDLVVSLKAASGELKDKVLGNMSEEVRASITEEMEFLGPMRLREVEEVQLRIVQQVRQLEEQGQITIVRGDGDDQFV